MTNTRTRISNIIYTPEEVNTISYTLTTLIDIFNQSEDSIICFVASLGLIKNENFCFLCGEQLKLYKKTTSKNNFRWQCKKSCGFSKSITSDSMFEGSHLKIEKIVLLMYMWCKEHMQKNIVEELGINKNTCSQWCNKFRERCEYAMEEENEIIGGVDENGNSIDVEIDESLFFKRKFNRGRLGRPIWVFGAFERNSGKCFFVPVEQRNATTLLGIINLRIRSGSRIISDQWAAYRSLTTHPNYEYASVNHTFNFVSSNDSSIHTQNIENLWCHVKRKLRIQFGTSEDFFESYFFEFMWRKK
jgi:transposase-like protein